MNSRKRPLILKSTSSTNSSKTSNSLISSNSIDPSGEKRILIRANNKILLINANRLPFSTPSTMIRPLQVALDSRPPVQLQFLKPMIQTDPNNFGLQQRFPNLTPIGGPNTYNNNRFPIPIINNNYELEKKVVEVKKDTSYEDDSTLVFIPAVPNNFKSRIRKDHFARKELAGIPNWFFSENRFKMEKNGPKPAITIPTEISVKDVTNNVNGNFSSGSCYNNSKESSIRNLKKFESIVKSSQHSTYELVRCKRKLMAQNLVRNELKQIRNRLLVQGKSSISKIIETLKIFSISRIRNKNKKKRKQMEKPENVENQENDVDHCSSDDEFYDQEKLFNQSNDRYYNMASMEKSYLLIKTTDPSEFQHAYPALDLDPVLFPNQLINDSRGLRNFHRVPLGCTLQPKKLGNSFCIVQSLNENIRNVEKRRKLLEMESDYNFGYSASFLRKKSDLSGQDGELVLFEYSEEYPPFLNQPGMASKVKNLLQKRPPLIDSTIPEDPGSMKNDQIGEDKYLGVKLQGHSTKYFLGKIKNPDQKITLLENNMFRAPVFEHLVPETDFLIIVDKSSLFIRPVKKIFCVGQELPMQKVPAPYSHVDMLFTKNIVLTNIYRLFLKSEDEPRQLRMEHLRAIFPKFSEPTLRKRLKSCAKFIRLPPGTDGSYWILMINFQLPSSSEMRKMMTPEMYCTHLSMLSAKQRLVDYGILETDNLVLFLDEDSKRRNKPENFDREVICAPWNTTSAFLGAIKEKKILNLKGVADPTGCGLGYSFVPIRRITELKTAEKEKNPIRGTDADLRKLNLEAAQNLLAKIGLPRNEIIALKRWEAINVIKTFCSQELKNMGHIGTKFGLNKYIRGSKITQKLYSLRQKCKQDGQEIFEAQIRWISGQENDSDSSKESESSDQEEEIEEINTSSNISGELFGDSEFFANLNANLLKPVQKEENYKVPKALETIVNHSTAKLDDEKIVNSSLNIYREYRSKSDGKKYTNLETISDSRLADAYMKIKAEKTPEEIARFLMRDPIFVKERHRYKKRLQDKLRRLKRKETLLAMGFDFSSKKHKGRLPSKPPKPRSPHLLNMRCSACGSKGHMKTNRHCPLFTTKKRPPSRTLQFNESALQFNESVVKIHGTKINIKLHSTTEKNYEPAGNSDTVQNRKSDPQIGTLQSEPSDNNNRICKVTKKRQSDQSQPAKRNQTKSTNQKREQASRDLSKKRRRHNPSVELNNWVTSLIDRLRMQVSVEPILTPPNKRRHPSYFRVVKENYRLNLADVKVKAAKLEYDSIGSALDDFRQIEQNYTEAFGPAHFFSRAAEAMIRYVQNEVSKDQDKLAALETEISGPNASPEKLSYFVQSIQSSANFFDFVSKRVKLELEEENVEISQANKNDDKPKLDDVIKEKLCLLISECSLLKSRLPRGDNPLQSLLEKCKPHHVLYWCDFTTMLMDVVEKLTVVDKDLVVKLVGEVEIIMQQNEVQNSRNTIVIKSEPIDKEDGGESFLASIRNQISELDRRAGVAVSTLKSEPLDFTG